MILAATFQGSSGGTILNKEGKVIGILSAKPTGIPVVYFQKLNSQMLKTIATANKSN